MFLPENTPECGMFCPGGRNGMGYFVGAAKVAWDVMSGMTKTAKDVHTS